MIATFDNFLLSNEMCVEIIELYKNKVSTIQNSIRKQKNYHERNLESWLFKTIKDLVNKNLGSGYELIDRVTILKYEKGDFFLEHRDGPRNYSINNDLPNHIYGGIELCEKDEYEGGEFFIKGNKVDYKKGRIFTHGFSDYHSITEVTSGIRWSLHFVIEKKINSLI